MTLKLYDPYTEVDLDWVHPSLQHIFLKLARNGWTPQGTQLLPNGRWADLTEKLKFEWSHLSDMDRADTYRKLNLLAIRARQLQNPHHIDHSRRSRSVILEMTTPGEMPVGSVKYAILRDIRVPMLDSRHFSKQETISLSLELLREGVWRGIKPGEAGFQYVTNQVIQAYTYSSNKHYVDVDLTGYAAVGDAPALTILRITPSSTLDDAFRVMVAQVDAQTASELNAITTHYWITGSGGNIVDISSIPFLEQLPTGKAYRLPAASSSNSFSWTIPNVHNYNGPFRLYAIAAPSEPAANPQLTVKHYWPDLTASFRTQMGPLLLTGGPTTTWYAWDMGIIDLPPNRSPNGLTYSQNYTADITFSHSGSGSSPFYLGGFFLMPLRGQVFTAENITLSFPDGQTMEMDGDVERTYALNGSNEVTSALMNTDGDYIRLTPGAVNRLYFYEMTTHIPSQTAGARILYHPATTYTINGWIIPLYQNIRGSM